MTSWSHETRNHETRNHKVTWPLVAIVAFIALSGVGCQRDGGVETDVEAFCAQTSGNQGLIIDPPLESQEQIDATIEFYELLQQLAPLEIEQDWGQLIEMLNTANEIVPGDAASEQLVAQTAYASELAAYNIATWVRVNCDITLPITTIVPHENEPLRPPFETYVPPTTDPASTSVPPGETVPGETVPGETVPGETASGESGSNGTDPAP